MAASAFALAGVAGGDDIPVHHIPKCGDVVGTAVLIVEVVGVFPDVETEDRAIAATAEVGSHDRIVLIGGGAHGELAILAAKPGPARTEAGGARLGEGLFECVKRPEGGIDCGCQGSGGGFGAAR